MKKLLLTVGFSFLALSAIKAQTESDVNVEKHLFGIQAGLFGVNLYNESKIADNTTIRSQIELYGGVWGGELYEKTGFILYPSLSIEPRYYYNLQNRANKGRNIKNNSANYFALLVSYTPDWFSISNYDDLKLSNKLRIIPSFGIRRNFAKDFNYEFYLGYGYGFTFGEKENTSGDAFDLGLKVGYDF